jgi:6-phosphogluconolactonase
MKPEIRIFKSLEELSRNAAKLFVETAAESIAARGRFLVALNGGSTPTRMFQLLASDFREEIDWIKTYVFWGDERLVPMHDPESSYGQARDLFLRHVPIPERNVHRVKTEQNPAEAVRDYSDTLKQFAVPPLEWIRFDLGFLGMGEDGHTASLFPGSPVDVNELVIPVIADYQGRPAQRVTLTPLVFNSARLVAFMATGEKKAATLAQVLSGRYNPELYPAQRIDPKDGKTIWLVDEDAASKLPMDLVRKFCEG